MADITWPVDLPQAFQKNGFSETAQSAVLKTDMDSGPQKVRRLFTSALTLWKGNMIMDSDQVTSFKNFYKNSIGYGSVRFNFPNQFNLSETVEVRMDIGTGGQPYSIVPDGETLDYSVSFSLEVF